MPKNLGLAMLATYAYVLLRKLLREKQEREIQYTKSR